jgi:predicted hydrocarbon binding protein
MVNMSGFGSIEIIEAKDKELQAIVNCINSPMAEYYFKTLKKSEAADEMLAGIIGGFFSQWFEKPVVCEEITCMAKGGRYCQFKVSSKK